METNSLPMPADAPEPGACIRVERPEPGLAVVIFDPPHRSFPVFDGPLVRDLKAVVRGLSEESGLRGVVFTGRKPDQFLAGADVEGIGSITEVQGAGDYVAKLKREYDAARARVLG